MKKIAIIGCGISGLYFANKLLSEKIYDFLLNGNEPSYVDMPIWYTHSITNIGSEPLITSFWINEPYNPNDPDTYYENV